MKSVNDEIDEYKLNKAYGKSGLRKNVEAVSTVGTMKTTQEQRL
jgi:hypothetical protein